MYKEKTRDLARVFLHLVSKEYFTKHFIIQFLTGGASTYTIYYLLYFIMEGFWFQKLIVFFCVCQIYEFLNTQFLDSR